MLSGGGAPPPSQISRDRGRSFLTGSDRGSPGGIRIAGNNRLPQVTPGRHRHRTPSEIWGGSFGNLGLTTRTYTREEAILVDFGHLSKSNPHTRTREEAIWGANNLLPKNRPHPHARGGDGGLLENSPKAFPHPHARGGTVSRANCLPLKTPTPARARRRSPSCQNSDKLHGHPHPHARGGD